MSNRPKPTVSIACGGTGGHLFPGLSVGESLRNRGIDVQILVSEKRVDREAVQSVSGMQVDFLPAVGLQGRNYLGFLWAAAQSWRRVARLFRDRRPAAVLAMGGFTSAPPLLAARQAGIPTFLHEANFIPGRANRLFARHAETVFLHFPGTQGHLRSERQCVVGMPVRRSLAAVDPQACRQSLGLDPQRPTLLVTGGSQGARFVNQLVHRSLNELARVIPGIQVLHLTGTTDYAAMQETYRSAPVPFRLEPFWHDMASALGAATAVVARAGASSLAEFAQLGLPSLLIPLPSAADNHQYFNARAYTDSGASRMLEQPQATEDPHRLIQELQALMLDAAVRERCREACRRWRHTDAADRVADALVETLARQSRVDSLAVPKPGSVHFQQALF